MTISIGSVGTNNTPDNGAANATTSAVSTVGASCLIGICLQKSGTSPLTPSDNSSNTWTRIGSQIANPGGTPSTIDRWYCPNPITGSAHTFKVSNTSGNSRFILALYPVFGSLSTSAVLDQSNTNTGSQALPWSAGNITLSSGNTANGELIIAAVNNDAGTQTSWSEANGFTIDISEIFGTGFPHNVSGAIAHKIVTSGGTYSASFSDGSTGSSDFAASIDSFIGAGSAPPVSYYLSDDSFF